jgi:hypothetical protein
MRFFLTLLWLQWDFLSYWIKLIYDCMIVIYLFIFLCDILGYRLQKMVMVDGNRLTLSQFQH